MGLFHNDFRAEDVEISVSCYTPCLRCLLVNKPLPRTVIL